MIKLTQAVIVEGKYDKIRLSNILDATIITTEGFGIFKDKQKLTYIRELAEKNGIIIITDSDSAGFLIRSHLLSAVPANKVKNVYIPDVFGKEKRKKTSSKEGLLGVEGIDEKTLIECFEKAGVCAEINDKRNIEIITSVDMFEAGLSGNKDSSQKRDALKRKLNLPLKMSSKGLLQALNALYSREEFFEILKSMQEVNHEDTQ